MKKRILSLMMAMMMVFSLLPTSVLATDGGNVDNTPLVECAGVAGQICAAVTHVEGCDSYVAPISEVTPAPIPEVKICAGVAGVECEAEAHIAGCDSYVAPAPEGTPEPTPEVKVCEADCILADGHEGNCAFCVGAEAGCLFAGDPEHKGEECFIEMPCTLTEGCELIAGHLGDCTGMAVMADEKLPIHFFLASPGNITNPDGTYTNYNLDSTKNNLESYVLNIKQDARWNEIRTENGIRNAYDESDVTKYVMSWPDGKTAAQFKDFGTVTIDGIRYSDEEYEIKWVSIMYRDNGSAGAGRNCNQYFTAQYEHIHIDGLLVKKVEIQPGKMEIYKSIPSALDTDTTFEFTLQKMLQPNLTTPPTSANAVDTSFAPLNLTATIDAGKTSALITGGSDISFGYYKLTEKSDAAWQIAGIELDDKTFDADTVYIRIAPDGTVQYSTSHNSSYTTADNVIIQNERKPVNVTYEWKLRNSDGTYSALPSTVTAVLPTYGEKYVPGTSHTVDTVWKDGTAVTDEANGKIYTFHGWDTYSSNSAFNVTVGGDYKSLDGVSSIVMDTNKYVYGYWTVTDLEKADSHITIKKVFVEGNRVMGADEVPKDYQIAVDGPYEGPNDAILYVEIGEGGFVRDANGVYTYELPIYRDGKYVITEQNYTLDGFDWEVITDIEENSSGHDHLTNASGKDTASITVYINRDYEGAGACADLGDISFINEYTRKTGADVHNLPSLEIYKYDSANHGTPLPNTVFTLTGGNIGPQTTNRYGKAYFTDIPAGEYVLAETTAPDGYAIVNKAYGVHVTQNEPVEKWMEDASGNKYWGKEYNYTLTVTLDGKPVSGFSNNTLEVPNAKITGSLTINKDVLGDLGEADFPNGFTVKVTKGTAEIGTYILDNSNEWYQTIDNLELGTYTITEVNPSVPGGYTLATTMTGATKINDTSCTVTLEATNETDAVVAKTVVINNTYTKNVGTEQYEYPTLNISKLRDSNLAAIDGAKFALFKNADDTTAIAGTESVTANGGKWSYTFNATNSEGTYYLKETASAPGYAENATVWKVVVAEYDETEALDETTNKFVTTHWYDVTVTEADGSAVNFVTATNTLTVFNTKDEGSVTIRKVFPISNPDHEKAAITAVNFELKGNGYSQEITLTQSDEIAGSATESTIWEKTISNLPLGEYTVEEISLTYIDARDEAITVYAAEDDVIIVFDNATQTEGESYHWNIAYTPARGEMTSAREDITLVVTNSFTVLEPVDLHIKKYDRLDDNGEPIENTSNALSGAVFSIWYAENGEKVGNPIVTSTTNANGEIIMPGFLNNASYILEEVTPPTNHGLGEYSKWKIVVEKIGDEDDATATVKMTVTPYDAEGNPVGTGTAVSSTPNGVGIFTLNVENPRNTNNLTITKEVEYYLDGQSIDDGLVEAHKKANASYDITITLSDSARASVSGTFGNYIFTNGVCTVSMASGETITIPDVPYGTYVTVSENTQGAAFVSGIIGNQQFVDGVNDAVTVKNTYNYTTVNAGLKVVKISGDTNEPLEDAIFTLYSDAECTKIVASDNSDADGNIDLAISDAGTYYLKESVAPVGYHPSDEVYEIKAEWSYDEVLYAGTAYARTIKRLVVTSDDLNTVEGEFTVTNTPIKPVVISVEKKWDDGEYWNRPDGVIAILYRDGEVYDEELLSVNNSWKHTWSGIGMTDEYTWAVGEVAVEGYQLVKDVGEGKYEFILVVEPTETTQEDAEDRTFTAELVNYREVKPIEISVEKAWEDNYSDDNKSEDRNLPESVEVQLYTVNKSGVKTPVGDSVVLSEENDWKHTWEDLTDNFNYTVDEVNVPEGYSKEVTINGLQFIITNTRVIKNVQINVEKIWDIPEGYEEKLPVGLEVHLYRNEETAPADTHILTADDDWKYTWLHLDDGTHLTDENNWTFKEIVPDGYVHEHDKDFKATLVEVTDTTKVYEVEITNHLDYEPIEITVQKVWDVPDGYTDIPESVEVQLYRDGEAYGDSVKLSEENDWTYTWKNAEGEEKYIDAFEWEVKETEVPKGYTSEVISEDGETQFAIVNTLEYDFVNVSVSKVWLNPKDYDKQPTSVVVVLYRDGEAYDTVTLSESNGWHYKWIGLEDCFKWTVDEPNVPKDYSKKITHIGNAWVITNAHKNIPLTGDDSNVLLWAGATGVAVVGLGASLIMLLKKRKKEEDEQA